MCLMSTSFPDIPFSPQMKLLFLSSGYLSFCFQILKNNHIRMVFLRISCNCSCNLSSKFCVKTLRISPPVFHRCRAMLPLEPAYPSQHTVHPVFFTGKIDKLSSQDSSIRPHNSTDCIGIDPQIYTADDLFFDWCFREYHIFCTNLILISQLNHFTFVSALLLPVLRLNLMLPFRFQGLGTGGWLDLT